MIRVLHPQLPRAEEYLELLRQIDASGVYVNGGELSAKLERSIVDSLRPQANRPWAGIEAVCVSSATTGLELALRAFSNEGTVVVPSLTFPAPALAALRDRRREVILADVDPETWQMTPLTVAKAILEAQAAPPGFVLPVAAFGAAVPPDDGWKAIRLRGGVVVVDAAGAYGNQVLDLDAFDALVFSLHATKALACGEGGAVVALRATANRIRRLANFGFVPGAAPLVCDIGTNGKLSEYAAAVGLAAVRSWPATSWDRIAMHQEYLGELERHAPEVKTQRRDPKGVYTLLPVELPIPRAAEVQQELARRGIETRRWYFPPLHRHPLFSEKCRLETDLQVTDRLAGRLLGLPFHPRLTPANIEYVCQELGAVLLKERT